MVNLVYKFSWLVWLFLILFFRDSNLEKLLILILSIPLCIIAVRRAINAREDWRPIAEEFHKDLEE